MTTDFGKKKAKLSPLFIRKTFESLCVCVRKVTESKEFETLKLEGKLKLEMVDF